MNEIKYKIYFEKEGCMLENGMRILVKKYDNGDKYACRHELKLTGEKFHRPQSDGILSLTDRELSVLIAGGTIII